MNCQMRFQRKKKRLNPKLKLGQTKRASSYAESVDEALCFPELISQLPCPAKDGEGDQRDRERDEELWIPVAVRADEIQPRDFVERAKIPDDHVQNFKEFAGSAPHA